jgi:hypothetical protein
MEIKVRPSHLTCVSDMVMEAGVDPWIAIKRVRDNPPKLNRKIDAVSWLIELLTDGKRPHSEIAALARQAGISKRKLREAAMEIPLKKTSGYSEDKAYYWTIWELR